jgi:hypothetical protein
MIPAFERAKTVHALDRAATVPGSSRSAVQEIQHFKKPEVSLQCTQNPITGSYSEPDEAVPHHPGLFLRCTLILSSHLLSGFPDVLLCSIFPA